MSDYMFIFCKRNTCIISTGYNLLKCFVLCFCHQPLVKQDKVVLFVKTLKTHTSKSGQRSLVVTFWGYTSTKFSFPGQSRAPTTLMNCSHLVYRLFIVWTMRRLYLRLFWTIEGKGSNIYILYIYTWNVLCFVRRLSPYIFMRKKCDRVHTTAVIKLKARPTTE